MVSCLIGVSNHPKTYKELTKAGNKCQEVSINNSENDSMDPETLCTVSYKFLTVSKKFLTFFPQKIIVFFCIFFTVICSFFLKHFLQFFPNPRKWPVISVPTTQEACSNIYWPRKCRFGPTRSVRPYRLYSNNTIVFTHLFFFGPFTLPHPANRERGLGAPLRGALPKAIAFCHSTNNH